MLIDENSPAVPIALFGAAIAGKPFVPVSYRLADDRLRSIVERVAPATVIAGAGVAARLAGIEGIEIVDRADLLAATEDTSIEETDGWGCDPESTAVLLFTSGTTGEPKAAVLRHLNLASYLVSSLEFGSAGEDQATIVSVPPYHIAAVSSVLSTTYTGRRVVQLESFDAKEWVRLVRDESVTHAMVVPTMLNRILDVVDADGGGLPSMRSLAYGGGPMPRPVVERAMGLLDGLDLVNAYGLTETSSTVAVLGPDDHRAAFGSEDRRCASAWARSVGCCPGSSSRSGIPRATRCPTVSSARSGSAASRCPASTSASIGTPTTAGSTPGTAGASTTRATCSCTDGSTT